MSTYLTKETIQSVSLFRSDTRTLCNIGVLLNKLSSSTAARRAIKMIIMTNEKIVAPNSIIRFVLVGMLL